MQGRTAKGSLGSCLTSLALGAVLSTQARAVPPMDGKAQSAKPAAAAAMEGWDLEPLAQAIGSPLSPSIWEFEAETAAVGTCNGAAAAGAGDGAAAAAPAVAAARPARRRPFGTVAKAPWIATVDRIQGYDPGLVHLVGEFGKDPQALSVRFDGKAVPFKMVNSSLLLVSPADIKAEAAVEVQLGQLVAEGRWFRGAFDPVTIQALFHPMGQGHQGNLISYSETRDLRTDGRGGLTCWGSQSECYRVVDYNWMVARAYDTMPEDPGLVLGSYAKAFIPAGGAAK